MNETLVMIVRSFIAFFTLFIFTRILGKKQISQLTFFDYIAGITIGTISGSFSVNLSLRGLPIFFALATWVLLSLSLQVIGLKSRKIAKYLDGEPTVLIMNGQIMEKALGKMRLRVDELMSQLRVLKIFDLTQVEFAVLETNGKLSVLKKGEYQNLTPKDLKLPSQYKGMSTELVYNGLIIEQNLEQVKLDRGWLLGELKKQGIQDLSEVMYASLDTQGNLFIDKFKDHVENYTDISDYHGPN